MIEAAGDTVALYGTEEPVDPPIVLCAGAAPSRFGGRTRADHAREAIGAAPALGLGFDPAEAEATRRVLPRLAELHPHRLVCHFDPRRGDERASLESAVAVAKALGAEPWLKVVVADVEGFAAEIAALDALVQSLVSPFRAVLLSPAADLKSMTPGQAWLPAPPPAEFHRAAQAAFPGAKLGCGMISTFTELNRKRPPLDHLDFIGFTTVALIHACDDASVIEGLEALPSIARSARDIAGHLPIVVGPSAIGLHLNPYGARPVPNSGNRRQAMALNDPRQRARLGAACALGYYAGLARAGVEAVVFGGTTGPFGVVHTVQPWPTPGFDREGDPYPIFFALQSLAALRGANLRALHLSEPGVIDGLAADRGDGSTWSWLISRRMRNRSSSAPGSRRSNHSDSSSAPSERRSGRAGLKAKSRRPPRRPLSPSLSAAPRPADQSSDRTFCDTRTARTRLEMVSPSLILASTSRIVPHLDDLSSNAAGVARVISPGVTGRLTVIRGGRTAAKLS